MFNVHRILVYSALALVLAEAVLILLSWLLSAALPDSGVRSILSSEGLRWFFGNYATLLSKPLLGDILLLAMAYGSLQGCRCLDVFRRAPHATSRPASRWMAASYRERRALFMAGAVLLTCIGAMLLLTITPHAVLLSATGQLFPSPFSSSLLPVIACSVCASSIVYGIIAGTYQSLSDIYEALLNGLRSAAALLLFYVLIVQFYESLLFVL